MTTLSLIWLHVQLFALLFAAQQLLPRLVRAARHRVAQRSVPMACGACALVLATSATASAAKNWPSFQNGGEVSFAEGAAPERLETAWTADITGYGQSSPVAWDGRVYVTSVSGPNKEQYHIAAFQLQDGQKLWQHDLPNPSPQESTRYVSKAAPTPAADANGLITFFEGGNLVALTHDGKLRWERNLVDEYGAIDARHGLAASVEQDDDTAYVWVERQTDPYLLAIDKQTGQNRWKVQGLEVTSWASPRLIPVADGRHLVLSGIGKLEGLDPATGERLWTFADLTGNSTPTPMPLGEGRFLIGATARDGDANAGRAAESNGVVEIRRQTDGTWQAGYVWKSKRATSSFGSPIRHGGQVYFVNRTGVLFCVDSASGKEHYVQRLGTSIWATPLGQEDRILLFGKDGVMKTIASGETFRELSETNLFAAAESPAEAESGTDAPPAAGPTLYAAIAADGVIVLRTGDRLFGLRP